MKPKNRVMCPDCGRQKMLFETKEKAINFIKFNGEEISNGKKLRWYYCPACGGFHISSKPYKKKYKGRTDKLIEAYKKQKKAMDDLEKSQIKYQRQTELVNKIYKRYFMDKNSSNIEEYVKKAYPSMDSDERGKIIQRLKHRLEYDTNENWNKLSKEEKNDIVNKVVQKIISFNVSDEELESVIKTECKNLNLPGGCYGTIKEKCVMIRNEMG